jgi:hypothetical protein
VYWARMARDRCEQCLFKGVMDSWWDESARGALSGADHTSQRLAAGSWLGKLCKGLPTSRSNIIYGK